MEVPLYAAYLILIIRLLAFLTVQLHIDPAESAGEAHMPELTAVLDAPTAEPDISATAPAARLYVDG